METNHLTEVLFAEMLQYTKDRYKCEMDRQESIVQQSGRMQSAFSFIMLSLFAIAPIAIDNSNVYINGKRVLSYGFFLLAFCSITTCLLISLIYATRAQKRYKGLTFVDYNKLFNFYVDKCDSLVNSNQRYRTMAGHYDKITNDLKIHNDERIQNIETSKLLFYISIGLCFFWGALALIQILLFYINH